jgi:hypothetical protein
MEIVFGNIENAIMATVWNIDVDGLVFSLLNIYNL